MSVLFLNAQPTVEFSGHTAEKPRSEKEHLKHDNDDKFGAHLNETKKTDTKSSAKVGLDETNDGQSDIPSDDNAGILFIQNTQGKTIKLPLNTQQLEYASNLDRVSLVDPEILEQFGGLANFMEAVRSLIPGNPDLSDVDIVYLPYQIDALNQENIGSETFPHLIVTNLSPAQLNALEEYGNRKMSAFSQSNAVEIDAVPAGELVNVLLTSNQPSSAGQQNIRDELQDQLTDSILQQLQDIQSASGNQTDIAPELTLREIIGLAQEGLQKPSTQFFSGTGQTPPSIGNENSLSTPTNAGASKAPSTTGSLNFSNLLHAFISTEILPLDLQEQITGSASHLALNTSALAKQASTPSQGVLGSHLAGQPHHASQIVATALQKASNGGNQKLSVLLNPPELGKVMIDIEMDAQSKMKVSMVTEKESAYALLQKDTGFLEQTLQKAGLDIESKDINLSFADQEAFMFEDQNKENVFDLYTNASNNGQDEDSIAEDIIETQVDIFKDPKIGHWQYSALI